MNIDSSFISPFRSYIRTTESEIEGILRHSMIMLDTNVLLSLYRATPSARNEMLQTLKATQERLWIPHQVALEFHRNRLNVANDQINFYTQTIKSVEVLKQQTLQKISEFADRCSLDEASKERMKDSAIEAFGFTIAEIERHQGRFDLGISTILNQDPILDELSVIFDGKIGPPFKAEELTKVLQEAERRVSEEIPPGYKDGSKVSNKFGDYILWEQTLIESESRGVDILIVSNDMKDDWVERFLGFAIGPRNELAVEMRSRAGVNLNMMTFPLFLEAAKRHLQTEVSLQTLAQASREVPPENREKPIVVQIAIPEDSIGLIREGLKESLTVAEKSATEKLQELSDLRASDGRDSSLIESVENLLAENRVEISMARNYIIYFENAIRKSSKTGDKIYLQMPQGAAEAVLDILRPNDAE
ncbi:PIN domain-containing protein [Streptomyces sp. WI04-05B]|uniref:PIN domain-containing protein n=1 Tax=Streptomyces TaxID=1883 RepID=UPI0029BC67DC|nr:MULTISPECIES: PIN domain-containing protein [unclassified Streptomyces]MDX2544455.1 PIN domain-containing protein [Streptomyces sp. WI04-05B]MDX2588476.1 PIN domain-containing protein [Streptomyces sp. WI04-05A]